MTPRFARWQQAVHCTGSAAPGARALMVGLLLGFPGARNLGIYNCRSTALGNRSAHSEGRADDVGCVMALGNQIVHALLHLPGGPASLGISAIIHNRVIYSRKSPNGRPYSGDPHTDHVHIEITRKAGRHLSLLRVKRVMGL